MLMSPTKTSERDTGNRFCGLAERPVIFSGETPRTLRSGRLSHVNHLHVLHGKTKRAPVRLRAAELSLVSLKIYVVLFSIYYILCRILQSRL